MLQVLQMKNSYWSHSEKHLLEFGSHLPVKQNKHTNNMKTYYQQ